MADRPPAIATARIAAHLANAGVARGMGTYMRHAVADQALREVYKIGWRLVRAATLADMARERDELLDELATVTAQRDRLLEQHVERVAGGGQAPWPFETRGRCANTIPAVWGARPMVCRLPAGHPGAHEDEGAQWTAGGEPPSAQPQDQGAHHG